MKRWATAILGLCLTTGCASGLRLHPVATEAQKPSNVMVLFQATAAGEGVADLDASGIAAREGDFPIVVGKDALFTRADFTRAQYNLLLVDTGGAPSPAELEALAAALAALGPRLAVGQRFAAYALDGGERPVPLVPFGTGPDGLRAGVERLAKLKPSDTTRDLFGGYVEGLAALEAATRDAVPRVANVVLIARGPDRAARADAKAVRAALEKLGPLVERWAVAVGPEARAGLDAFASRPIATATDVRALDAPLGEVAGGIERRGGSFYFFSYCSAARAGQHRLRLEAKRTLTMPGGDTAEQRGKLDVEFSADGFGAGCTPRAEDSWR